MQVELQLDVLRDGGVSATLTKGNREVTIVVSSEDDMCYFTAEKDGVARSGIVKGLWGLANLLTWLEGKPIDLREATGLKMGG